MKPALLLLAVVSVLVFAATAQADTAEENFLDSLKANGIVFTVRNDGLAVGHFVCAELFAGETTRSVSGLIQDKASMTSKKADVVVAQSVAAFCPSLTKTLA